MYSNVVQKQFQMMHLTRRTYFDSKNIDGIPAESWATAVPRVPESAGQNLQKMS